ncbi:MAG TPA: hypothetical protein VK171_00670, partial [Fimbriimonas sp.]|nr:hypothetical protein [Fimbriimonas sp.]
NSTQVRIYLVDAETQSAKQLFSEVYEKKILPNFEIDTSPLLKHAIVKMSLNNQVRHLVLCQGTASLVPSPDLDRASKQGLNGPSWSVDGTAVYGEFPNNKIVYLGGAKVITTDSQSEVEALTAQNTIRISEVVLTFDKSDRSEAVVTSRLAVFKPTPEKGSAVLELMPSNPVLRPVKFRGPWSFANMMKLPLSSKNHPILLTYGKSSQQDHSVWLKRGTDPSAPGTLLAVHASKVWIDPAQTGVAYLIDGALFFRTINEAK